MDDSSPSNSETRLDEYLVAESVRCQRCRYNLRGLHAGGQCPECGLDVWATLTHVVDPAAGRLPQLSNPRGVGDALVWLIGCVVGTVLLQFARPIAHRLEAFEWVEAGTFSSLTPHSLMLIAGGVILLGLWSVFRLRPPHDAAARPGVGRELTAIAAGLVVWSGLAIGVWAAGWADDGLRPGERPSIGEMRWQTVAHLLGVTAFILIMSGLRGILSVIGERSREYRNARGGRQRILEMNVAGIGVAVGQLLRLFGREMRVPTVLAVGSVVLWICTLMLVIGLLYLLANVWWIRRSLRKPAPALRDLLRPPESRPRGGTTGPGMS